MVRMWIVKKDVLSLTSTSFEGGNNACWLGFVGDNYIECLNAAIWKKLLMDFYKVCKEVEHFEEVKTEEDLMDCYLVSEMKLENLED